MQKLEYSITINAEPSRVWNTMLEPGKYEQWVKAFSDGSTFEGKWEQGAAVRFVDPSMGGTKAILEIYRPYECILAKHVAIVTKEGEEETETDVAKQWIGTTEKYIFSEQDGGTKLTIEMSTHASFVEMFNSCWPKALDTIKALAEEA